MSLSICITNTQIPPSAHHTHQHTTTITLQARFSLKHNYKPTKINKIPKANTHSLHHVESIRVINRQISGSHQYCKVRYPRAFRNPQAVPPDHIGGFHSPEGKYVSIQARNTVRFSPIGSSYRH